MASARLEPRIDYQMEVDVMKVGMDFPERIQGHNISQSGMFLAAPNAYRIGDRVSLRFNTKSDEEVYVRSAEVVWVRGEVDAQFVSGPPGVGVRFLALESSGRTRIANYIHSQTQEEKADGVSVSLRPNPALQKLTPEEEKLSSARQWLAYEEESSQQVPQATSEKIEDWSFSVQPDSGIYPSHEDAVDNASPNSLVREALTTFQCESSIDIAPSQKEQSPSSLEAELIQPEGGILNERADLLSGSDALPVVQGTEDEKGEKLGCEDGSDSSPGWIDLSFDDDAPKQIHASGPTHLFVEEDEPETEDTQQEFQASIQHDVASLDAAFEAPDTSIAEIEEWFERDAHDGKEDQQKKSRPLATFAGIAIAVLFAAGVYRTQVLSAEAVMRISEPTENQLEEGNLKSNTKPQGVKPETMVSQKPTQVAQLDQKKRTPKLAPRLDKSQKANAETGKEKNAQPKPLFPQTEAVKAEIKASKDATAIGSASVPSVRPEIYVEHGRVTLPLLDGKVVNKFALSSPSRVVVDLVGAQFPGHQKNQIQDKGIAELRIGKPNAKEVRVVIELARDKLATRITTVKRKDTLAIAWR